MATWSRALETGLEDLDAHHRELFSLHAEVLEACERGDREAAGGALERLLEEARDHFEEEQGRMAELEDPLLPGHREAHETFLEDAARLRWELAHHGLTPLFQLWIGSRFPGWLKLHVQTLDAAFGRLARAHRLRH